MAEERLTQRLHILLTPKSLKRLTALAWRRRITVSAMVRRLIEDAWLHDKRKKQSTHESPDTFFD